MRNAKGSRRIVIQATEYRWRAKGNDGYISIGIWPTNNIGPYIGGNLGYHETWLNAGQGSWSSAGDQVVITNRIIRRIVQYAIVDLGYDPNEKGSQLNLKNLEDFIDWNDAIRATKNPS